MAISGYRILRKIRQGGMSTVYLAIQKSVDREVALKVMSPSLTADESFSSRFYREAKIVGQLSHPNIVSIYDVGSNKQYNYIAMDYLPSGTLQDRMEKGINADQAIEITCEIASALAYAHERGYVHRDIKPDNILFRENGSAVLCDFGIAKSHNVSVKMTQIGAVLGTPQYMSPEQVQGKDVDSRADLYSLGAVLYEMLSGSVPFPGTDAVAIAVKHVSANIPSLAPEHKKFQAIINRLLAKNPSARIQSGLELIKAINALQTNVNTASTNQHYFDSLLASMSKALSGARAHILGYYSKTALCVNRFLLGKKLFAARTIQLSKSQLDEIDVFVLNTNPPDSEFTNKSDRPSFAQLLQEAQKSKPSVDWLYWPLTVAAVVIIAALVFSLNRTKPIESYVATENTNTKQDLPQIQFLKETTGDTELENVTKQENTPPSTNALTKMDETSAQAELSTLDSTHNQPDDSGIDNASLQAAIAIANAWNNQEQISLSNLVTQATEADLDLTPILADQNPSDNDSKNSAVLISASSVSAPASSVSTSAASAPTSSVSTSSASAPTSSVSASSASTPTSPVSTSSASAPTSPVSTSAASAPTPPVSTSAVSAPTSSVSTSAASAPTSPVSTSAASAPTSSVSTSAASAPTSPISTSSTPTPTPTPTPTIKTKKSKKAKNNKKSVKKTKVVATYPLTISANPANATIKILNIKPRYQPQIKLAAGLYHLKVSAAKYETQQFWLEVSDQSIIHTVNLLSSRALLSAGTIISDELAIGGKAPIMVVLPKKNVVDHSAPIAIGQYEVTFKEYDRFAKYTKRNFPSDYQWGRGSRPVIGITHADAKAYARWISKQTGFTYRLPTQQEWEYATHATQGSKYWWGEFSLSGRANCRKGCNSKWSKLFRSLTAPVGSNLENNNKLHDIVGNASEWLADCIRWKNETKTQCVLALAAGGSHQKDATKISRDPVISAAATKDYKTIGMRLILDL